MKMMVKGQNIKKIKSKTVSVFFLNLLLQVQSRDMTRKREGKTGFHSDRNTSKCVLIKINDIINKYNY